jgi:hypothetical protein
MSKRETYSHILQQTNDWDAYLCAESGLPGPRGNLELAQAAADLGTPAQFASWLGWTAERAPVNSPEEFLAFCGAVGLGRLAAEGHLEVLERLRQCAADPRWRMREGVAMALQRLGQHDMDALLQALPPWIEGRPYEMRAVAAGLCEPALLKQPRHAAPVIGALDRITARLATWPERKSAEFQALRQGMGYCWSVAVAAYPAEGMPRLAAWAESPDRDVRWVVRENLKKQRLIRVDELWAADLRTRCA